jgi:hypothetical protein
LDTMKDIRLFLEKHLPGRSVELHSGPVAVQ